VTAKAGGDAGAEVEPAVVVVVAGGEGAGGGGGEDVVEVGVEVVVPLVDPGTVGSGGTVGSVVGTVGIVVVMQTTVHSEACGAAAGVKRETADAMPPAKTATATAILGIRPRLRRSIGAPPWTGTG
jgi:hypothetical protein